MKTRPQIAIGASVAVMASAVTDAGEPMQRIRLIPMGRFGRRDSAQAYELTDLAHAERVVVESRALAAGVDPVFDYDHQTEYGPRPGVGGTAIAAGWVKGLAAEPDGIWADVEWTPAAAERLAAREYRYVSPVFKHDARGRVTALLRAALTNNPAVGQLAAVASADALVLDSPTDKGPSMSLTAIASALGLGDTASEAQCLDAITALKGAKDGLIAVAQAAGLQADAGLDQVVAAVGAVKTGGDQVAVLAAELNTLKAERARERAEAKVEEAVAAGKITPSARDQFIALCAANEAQFDAIVAAMPAILKPGPKPVGRSTTAEPELTEDEKAVCALMGWDEAVFLAEKKEA